MISSSQCIAMLRPFSLPNPSILCFSSLYWFSGLLSLIISLGKVGRRVVTKHKFSPCLMLNLIEKYKINVGFANSTQAALIAQSPELKLADLSSVRALVVGGSALPDFIRASIQEHLLNGYLYFGYAMTEIGTISTTLPLQKTSNSVGNILPNYMLKVNFCCRQNY